VKVGGAPPVHRYTDLSNQQKKPCICEAAVRFMGKEVSLKLSRMRFRSGLENWGSAHLVSRTKFSEESMHL
jgi:hypothetical protein